MANQIHDTDYLFLTTRVRALECQLLDRGQMEQMLEAATPQEAARLLTDCGYPELDPVNGETLGAMLAREREKTFQDLGELVPDPAVLAVFQVQHDYHNLKVLLKSEAMGLDGDRLLVDTGRVAPETLAEAVKRSEFTDLPKVMADAIVEARAVLGKTRDPQRSDMILDQAYFQEMEQLAKDSGSQFLLGYVQMLVDAANLRSVVRVLRMGRDADFLATVLFPGGTIPAATVVKAADGEPLESIYFSSLFEEAAAAGVQAIQGGSLTAFEKAKYIPFGEQPMLGYVSAKDNEFTAIRIILTGRLADLPADVIRERLRNAYV